MNKSASVENKIVKADTQNRSSRPDWEFNATSLQGCWEIQLPMSHDLRGRFVKTFQHTKFVSKKLSWEFREVFFSVSGERVLRGMHVQAPPADQAKLVYCISGAVMDVVLDLRCGSPTFGRFEVVELDSELGNALYIPRGFAHGFYVRSAPAAMMYHVSSEYASAFDLGIAWNSFGAPWPDPAPVLSERDKTFPSLSKFDSPFRHEFEGDHQD